MSNKIPLTGKDAKIVLKLKDAADTARFHLLNTPESATDRAEVLRRLLESLDDFEAIIPEIIPACDFDLTFHPGRTYKVCRKCDQPARRDLVDTSEGKRWRSTCCIAPLGTAWAPCRCGAEYKAE